MKFVCLPALFSFLSWQMLLTFNFKSEESLQEFFFVPTQHKTIYLCHLHMKMCKNAFLFIEWSGWKEWREDCVSSKCLCLTSSKTRSESWCSIHVTCIEYPQVLFGFKVFTFTLFLSSRDRCSSHYSDWIHDEHLHHEDKFFGLRGEKVLYLLSPGFQ